jgi:hypothetical protein
MRCKRRLNMLSAAVVALAFAAIPGRGGESIRQGDFRYTKSLQPPAETAHEVASFEIDEEIYRDVGDLQAGLRLYAADGAELPFIVRRKEKRRTVVKDKTLGAKLDSFKKRPDGSVEIRVSRQRADPPVDALSFVTQLRNFEKQVSVYGDRGNGDWELLAENQPIFDYSRYLDLWNTRVALKRSGHVRFRVEVSAIEESQQSPLVRIVRDSRGGEAFGEQEHLSFKRVDFRIEGIGLVSRVEETRAAGPALRDYTVGDLIVAADEETRETVVVLETARTPLTELTVETESVNFKRAVIVEASDTADEDDWRRVTSASIAKIAVGSFRRDERRILLGGVRRFRRYRLRVRNENSPPIAIDAVRARGEIREGIFFVPEGDVPDVHFGGGDVPRPTYDIAGVLGQVPFADTDEYELGARQDNALFSSETRREPIDTKVFLVIAILATVAILGWLIARTSGKLQPEA